MTASYPGTTRRFFIFNPGMRAARPTRPRRLKMDDRVLITGGAGFIGSHLGRHLLERGSRSRARDTPLPRGPEGSPPPAYLDDDVELVEGDIRDRDSVERALDDVDTVKPAAARVGVGQSMYEIAENTSVN